MRLLAIVLAVAGVLLVVAPPLAGLGGSLLYLAPLCFVVAGVLAARAAERRGGLLVLAGVVLAIAVLVLPGVVNGVRNGRGIAWSVPEPENVVFAEAGMAVTEMDEATVLTGRDLDTGDRRWRLDLGKPSDPTGQLGIQRVDRTLLVIARDGVLRAVDLGTGKERWKTPSADVLIPAVASPAVVAMTRCAGSDDCTVEARSVQDGAVLWRAPVVLDGAFLGAPGGGEQLDDREKLWPASVVIARVPPEGVRYEARSLESGRVVARGSTERETLGVIGNLFLRATDAGVVSATDVESGREVWTSQASPVRAESVRSQWLGMPDGGLVLFSQPQPLPLLSLGTTLRLLDPRTGKVTEHPIDLPPGPVELFATDGPDITAKSATAGVTPLVPVLRSDDALQVDGRRYDADDLNSFSISVTATQVAWKSALPSFGSGDRDGISVYDRRTGERLVHYVADEVRVRAVGERLVIGNGNGDEGADQEYVVALP
jgi:outer membrane protein assembly factor BamB